MLLILAGEYIESELSAEFGRIPPCFLPVGNKRLYVYQIGRFAQNYASIAMTLPADFTLDQTAQKYFAANNVTVVRTTPGVSIGSAVCEFLDKSVYNGRLDILYGDTLITDESAAGTDWLAVGKSDEYYHWHHDRTPAYTGANIWAGMFSFSDSAGLRAQLAREPSFITAVERYSETVAPLEKRPTQTWLDFGHVHTYFSSKRFITTQRHFNQIRISDGVLRKTSSDTAKMRAEAAWFHRAPPQIKVFLPKFIEGDLIEGSGYALEYLSLAALNEIFVFGKLPTIVWAKIFHACNEYLSAASQVPLPEPLDPQLMVELYRGKTLARLAQFSQQRGVDLERGWTLNGSEVPSLTAIADEAAGAVLASGQGRDSFVHGDFCFSNILFDFRAARVKLIDPRGLDVQGRLTSFGDFRYEIGKLAHSVIGLYDFIIAGHFSVALTGYSVDFHLDTVGTDDLTTLFLDTEFSGRKPFEWDCYPVMILLFLSMLPLHVDNEVRQRGLMANCLRLYLEWRCCINLAVAVAGDAQRS